MTAKKNPSINRIRSRSRELRQRIASMDFVASGTLHTRTKVCGRKNCRCATNPEHRHGPYHEWSRRKDGRLQHKLVTPAQARLIQRAISNYRQILILLARWEDETVSEILSQDQTENHK